MRPAAVGDNLPLRIQFMQMLLQLFQWYIDCSRYMPGFVFLRGTYIQAGATIGAG